MMKAAEKGPARFASDLFDLRQQGPLATDGGVSEDYVLGTGDQLYLNATGSAGFDLSTQVDGRGEITIPKLGSAKVGGLNLGQAKAAVQRLVNQSYSRTTVDLQVVKLREIRVSVLGEVYKPGSYLVSSLGSLVNVLSLAGGPTAVGSYRDIRVVRGGKVVFSLDLYPLRSEGLGNPNFALQSGDTVFVPLATELVSVEGAFTRVVHQPNKKSATADFLSITPEDEQRNALVREYGSILAQLDPVTAQHVMTTSTPAPGDAFNASAMSAIAPSPANGVLNQNLATPVTPRTQAVYSAMGFDAAKGQQQNAQSLGIPVLDPVLRQALENRLFYLRNQILDLDDQKRADHRLDVDPVTKLPRAPVTNSNEPDWQRWWEQTGKAPVMSFELKRGESLADLVNYAGGLVPEAGLGPIAVRSRGLDGRLVVASVRAEAGDEARVALHRGDVVSAMLAKTTSDRMVQVEGWARVPGAFERVEGLRVGDLLKRNQQALPDTYLHHGEIIRTLPDGTSQFFSFDVAKAMDGDAAQNLLLADRDRVELYRTDDLRLQKTITLLGPVARPGVYEFHEGMRAADLIFRAGVPQKNADRFEAELAHTQNGKPSLVQKLDLTKLLSTDASSPVALTDEAVNPLLLPDDQLSIFEKPGYKVHKTVQLQGQVLHPGSYVLDHDHETLSELVARAGGLTPEAMPYAGIFLRQLGQLAPDASLSSALKRNTNGMTPDDPTSNGVNSVLARLNETKRNPLSGQLLDSPLLHGLATGDMNRLVVNFSQALKGDKKADVELVDGDVVVIPRQMDVAYVVGEAASPFAAYKVEKGQSVRDLLRLAGGPTRNADTWNIRLLKADGRIIDSWVMRKKVEPGDTVLVPQRIRRDSTWQENLQALTPLAIVLNTLK
ncbi:MAG TPA: SLBB domain-containing protein [Holophagaceae bacterium]|nr:SLBB domain-containing protein [Holophagaceae bacterium]